MGTLLEALNKDAERRRRLQVLIRVCPSCESQQIQLVDWLTPLAMYKCRICALVFHIQDQEEPKHVGQ